MSASADEENKTAVSTAQSDYLQPAEAGFACVDAVSTAV